MATPQASEFSFQPSFNFQKNTARSTNEHIQSPISPRTGEVRVNVKCRSQDAKAGSVSANVHEQNKQQNKTKARTKKQNKIDANRGMAGRTRNQAKKKISFEEELKEKSDDKLKRKNKEKE